MVRTNRLLSLLQGRHGKRRVQKFFCCVCIRCHVEVFTVQLPSNNRGIYIRTHRLMGGIYEVRRWDGITCRDIHTKFHKYGSGIKKLMGGDAQIYRQYDDRINRLLYFFKIGKVDWPPLWYSGQSSWLQIQKYRVRFPALPDFLKSSGSGQGSTEPREDDWGTTWMEK
jgi:hypothetical protein